MRSSRALTLVGALAVATLAFTGCGAGSDSGGDEASYQIYALLPQGTDQPYGTSYLPAMQAKADELGIELTITNSKYDADQQASECEVAVAAQPDLIVLWPAVGDTVRPCLAAAQAAGIPVTVTNSDVNPEDKDLTAGFSGPDTYGQGVASAEIMCELAGDEEVGILMVNGLTGNSTATTRRGGFVDTIEESCPNVTILAEQPGNWSKDDSQIAVSEMLTSVGAANVKGIYAADDTMVAGAIDALKARDIDPASLFITSIGNTKLGNPLVISGELDGTIFQSSSWDGENSMVFAEQVLAGDAVDDLLMPSIKVTAENASDPDVTPEW
ncbi:sugar ABC transporter substrate-binding protein [Microbacterium allomyrinae]|uniref:Sugar ABC transporter substrate-binding protein n=1 Tax=Microbacterium allomyrinae TaxID=2830666 RepID=A0A9X1LT88_9MICO|nr:sugar ABC transporter substrate-binding protein [Microbacterium allomyrinae]MCC2031540.1 sugar ABC transporter substrate-binding protein [Microbacterium allomyrinae]